MTWIRFSFVFLTVLCCFGITSTLASSRKKILFSGRVMDVIRETRRAPGETLWKRCLSTPTKPSEKNSEICLSETAYQHRGTRKKSKKTNQVAIIQWQRQCLRDKPYRKPWPKSKTSDISKQSPSPLHHTFLLGRARFTAQPLSALVTMVRKVKSLCLPCLYF